jgi:putative phosphoribosyl transferase
MFRDRQEAGRLLAETLMPFKGSNTIVLALPRGGVPVAYQVARQLELPLEVLICRKLGVPGHEEFAFGAIAEGGVRYLEEETVRSLGLTAAQIEAVQRLETKTLEERIRLFRGNKKMMNLKGKRALIIDDGVATGATARAACLAARRFEAETVVVAVPVGPADTEASIPEADEVICLTHPGFFTAVGNHYANFEQVLDSDVLRILNQVNQPI